jgi:hypothetical protein
MQLMRNLSVLLGALILGAVMLQISHPLRYAVEPSFNTVTLASMSESGLRLPPQQAQAALQNARTTMSKRNTGGSWATQLATWATWFNIACSIVITLALGWAGKSVTPAQVGNPQSLVGLPPRWAKVIGFAAALAGASAFGGNEAKQYAEQRFAAARQLQVLISETERALTTGDAISQREALDLLLLEAQKP